MADADLSINISVSPNPVSINQDLVCTITAANLGPDEDGEVKVTAGIPAEFCLKTITVEQGEYTISNGEITWKVGELDSETSNTMQYTVKPKISGPYQVGASIGGSETDDDQSNNAAIAPVTVLPSADLSVYKDAYPSKVKVGDTFTYVVIIVNNGPSAATGVVVSDTFIGDVSPQTVVPSQGACGPFVGGSISCTLGAMAAHDVAQIIIMAKAGAAGVIQNTATVTSDVEDPVAENNSTAQIINVSPACDLAVVKTAAPQMAVLGEEYTYTINVTNKGPSEATGVEAVDTLPSQVNIVSVVPSCPVSGNVVTCDLGAFATGETKTISIKVIPTQTGILTNSVSVSAIEADPDLCNNSANIDVFVGSVQGTDLSVTKTHFPEPAHVCQHLIYTLEVTNNGPEQATGVTVFDQLPPGLEVISVIPGKGYCCYPWDGKCGCKGDCCPEKNNCRPRQDIICHLGSLAVGESATVEIEVEPQRTGEYTNTAIVTANQTELNPSNNQATDTVTVKRKHHHKC